MVLSSWRSRLGLSLSVVAALWAAGANAQMTTQMLIGDAVPEVTSKYSDIDQAIQRFNNRDVPGARLLIESAKRKDPSLPPVDVILAKMYFLTGNTAAGRTSLEKTGLEVPGDPEAHLLLADQALRQGRFIEAEALNDKALAILDSFNENPKRKRNFQIAARAGRAAVYERRKDWAAAAKDLQELLKIDPKNAAAHYRLGQALFMQKQYAPGYEEFKTARNEDTAKNLPIPDVAAALMYDQLAQAADAKDQPGLQEKAKQFFSRALAAGKPEPATLTAYAQWLIKTGSIAEAEKILAEARASNPDVLNLLILSGITARMNKQMKPAEDFFMEALRISPANADTLNQLALLLIDQAEPAKRQRAFEFAGINSRLNEQSADAQVTLAWVLFQLGRAADAQQSLRNAIQLGNLNPDSRYLLAKMLAENNPEAAKQILQEALDNDAGVIFVNRQDAQSLLESLNR